MPTKAEKDAVTGQQIRGHAWDGIHELDTPLPKWWLYVLYATILWSAVYVVLYPSIPGLDGYVRGTLGYSSRTELADRVAEAQAAQAGFRERIAAADMAAIAADPELAGFAAAGGRAAFANNCATCHGQGGAGRPGGYPVLADDDWIWGGTPDAILHTVRVGIRSDHPDTRISDMPRFGADALLTAQQIDEVTQAVLALSNRADDPAQAARGAAVFAENCAVCHGETGQGNPELGAPDLADAIWLYGGDADAIRASIALPHAGMMPAWEGRLDPVTLKMVAHYVHGLGGGQ